MTSATPQIKSLLPLGLRLGFLAVSVWLVTLMVDVGALGQQLSRVQPWALVVALMLQSLTIALWSWRWHVILQAFRSVARFAESLRMTHVSTFLNMVLPTSIGGDIGRVWMATRRGLNLRQSTFAAIFDRAVGLLTLILVAVLGGLLTRQLFEVQTVPKLSMLGGMLIASVVFLVWRTRRARALARDGQRRPLASLFAELLEPLLVTQSIAVSVAGHLLAVAVAVVLARGLAFDLSVAEALFLFPAVLLAASLPVSVGGWGVRELTAIPVFALIGMKADTAAAMALLFGATHVAAAGLGAGVALIAVPGRLD